MPHHADPDDVAQLRDRILEDLAPSRLLPRQSESLCARFDEQP
jgi:hypothetical protein